eukprot:m51a1_g8482 hypothetical protein (510) ;mRNA; f:523997-525798
MEREVDETTSLDPQPQRTSTPVVVAPQAPQAPLPAVPPSPGHTHSVARRGLSILLLSSITIALYVNYDSPGAVTPMLKEDWNMTSAQLGMSYSLYSAPNLVVPIVAGLLVDRFGGLGLAVFVAVSFITFGSVLVAVASGNVAVFLAGRLFLGVGGETSLATLARCAARIFPAETLGFVNAMLFLVGQVAAFCLFNLLPTVVQKTSLPIAFAISTACTVLVLGLAGLFVFVFRKQILAKPKADVKEVALAGLSDSNSSASSGTSLSDIEIPVAENTKTKWTWTDPIQAFFHTLMGITLRFWLCLLSSCTSLALVVVYMFFSTDLLVDKWDIEDVVAARLSSIIVISAIICSIPIGFGIDKLGHRVTGIIACSVGMLVSFLGLVLAPHGSCIAIPIVANVLVGVTYAYMLIVQGSCYPICLQESLLTTGFGMSFSLVMLINTVVPTVIGHLRDSTGNYTGGLWILVGLSATAVVSSSATAVADRAYPNNSLQKPQIPASPPTGNQTVPTVV